MKITSIVLTSILFLSLHVRAGEVDPFYAIDSEISDSKILINNYLNNSITTILSTYTKQSSCKNTALHIMQEMGTTNYFITNIGALNSKLEIWVNNNNNIHRVPKYGYSTDLYTKESIYAPQLKIFYLYPKDIDSTININGIHFGIDKLSHLLGSGYEYYKIYLKAKSNNSSEFMAELSAIKWGIEMEETILGLWAVGIFSYADLEANYQGFKMAQDFCNNSLLEYKDKKWQLTKEIRIEDYVNPYWDEAYNPNSYTTDREEEVRDNIVNIGICKKINWKAYHKRFSFYANLLKNSSSNLSRDILSNFSTQNEALTLERYCNDFELN